VIVALTKSVDGRSIGVKELRGVGRQEEQGKIRGFFIM
jgi:hypothetical protein